ncbi:hypothetical protein AB6C43_22765, partial [Vibrio splendidus]
LKNNMSLNAVSSLTGADQSFVWAFLLIGIREHDLKYAKKHIVMKVRILVSDRHHQYWTLR